MEQQELIFPGLRVGWGPADSQLSGPPLAAVAGKAPFLAAGLWHSRWLCSTSLIRGPVANWGSVAPPSGFEKLDDKHEIHQKEM